MAVPIDWQTVELVWDDRTGYPVHDAYRDYHRRTVHDLRPWNNGGGAYDSEARARSRASTRATSWTARSRLDATRPSGGRAADLRARHRAARPLVVRGPGVARGGGRGGPRRGLDLVTVSDGLERVEPVERRARGVHVGHRQGPLHLGLAAGGRARVRRARRASCAPWRPRRARVRPWSGGARAAGDPVQRLGVPGHARAGGRLPAAPCAGGHAAPRRDALSDSALGPGPAQPRAGPGPRLAGGAVRVLILSWEYPPLIEGGLARHVRKLAENLVDQGVEVHVLARGHGGVARRGGDGGRDRAPRARARAPARAHRVRRLDRAHERRHAGRAAWRWGTATTSTSCTATTGWWPWPATTWPSASAARSWSPSTPPSTAATRAGWTSTRSPTSTGSSAGWPTAPSG